MKLKFEFESPRILLLITLLKGDLYLKMSSVRKKKGGVFDLNYSPVVGLYIYMLKFYEFRRFLVIDRVLRLGDIFIYEQNARFRILPLFGFM